MSEESGRVLVVDDNAITRRELAEVLGEQGHAVSLAVDGRQALAMLEQEPYDLVLLDIIMPVVDGFEVLDRMNANGMLTEIPVIVISAMDEMDSVVKCVQMGAEDYLSKPFNHVLLEARVGATIEKKRLRDHEREFMRQLQVEQQRLTEYTAELKASNEELDAFAHTVAHDLKTPLGVMTGCAELLEVELRGTLGDRQREYLDAILQSSQKMNNITDALLTLASVRQMAPTDLVDLDMHLIVSETCDRLSRLIMERQANIRLPDKWPIAVGYAPWVEEVWVNYLSNAVLYGGDPPNILLGADSPGDGQVRFWVKDEGEGLSVEEQERLFTPFTRLSHVSARGHGLGLSITRRIVEKLGGMVTVNSSPGRGSTFSFTLPSGASRRS